MTMYRIECEECDTVSIIETFNGAKYCPACGRRAEAEPLREGLESLDQAGWDPHEEFDE